MFARLVLDRRRGWLWWSVGVGAAVAFVAGLFPSVRDNESFAEITEDLPEGLQSLFGIEPGTLITSAVGYLDARWFATTLPVLLVVYGIGLGAASIAGSEEDGTLELLMANPVSRTRVLFERVAAMVLLVVLLGVVAAVLLVAVAPPVGLDEGIGVGGLVAATVGVLLMSLVHAALANAIGAATGRRAAALAVASVVAVAGFLVQGLATLAAPLEPFRWLSPWHWYLDADALTDGLSVASVVLPLAVGVLLVAAGWVLFVRRDLT